MESRLKRDGVKGVDEKKFAWDDSRWYVRDIDILEVEDGGLYAYGEVLFSYNDEEGGSHEYLYRIDGRANGDPDKLICVYGDEKIPYYWDVRDAIEAEIKKRIERGEYNE